MIVIGLIGDFDPAVTAHRAIPKAIALAAERLGVDANARWVGTDTIPDDPRGMLADCAGLWCVPASPYRNTAGALAAIRHARESGTPFLGTCGGFQHAILEYARNVLGYPEAAHAELESDATLLLLAPLACSLVERTGEIELLPGTQLRSICGADRIQESYHCSYGLNPAHERLLDEGNLRVSGRDSSGEVRSVELSGHPFFIATLFQPERSALAGKVHPLASALLAAADRRSRRPE